ncbi:MAG: glycosyltransferase [Bacteroidales bacterium]|nr:glycosyltransferase [Bacteroidales bacterium]
MSLNVFDKQGCKETNILFVTNKNVNPLIGGIERVTHVLANAFSQTYGYQCYSAFTQHLAPTPASPFCGELLIDSANVAGSLAHFIRSNNIDVVIAQGADAAVGSIVGDIRKAVDSRDGCKLLFVFHNKPGFEHTRMSYETLLYRILHGQDLSYNLKYLLFQLFGTCAKPLLARKLQAKYKPACTLADRLVLLSPRYIDSYAACAGVRPDGKFVAIGNPASFDTNFNMQRYDELKRNEVLFVGRFDDKHKRLSQALRIWQLVERDGRFPQWTLRIVGYGPDESYCRALARRLALRQIAFIGMTDSRPYYTSASLFISTSAFEGFPMVLLEALQMAVVPLAFDSYGALHDIINDRRNGVIIPDGDRRAFAARLMELMEKHRLRRQTAAQAVLSVEKHSLQNIASQWNRLLQEILP